jgi:branched-chain amino acid aminotransferase
MWGDFIRGLLEAYDRDAVLPILSDGEGNVTEGPGVNVFAVRAGALHTPDRGVLEGITRQTVLDIAAELGVEADVGSVPVSALYEADEIFLTSTAGGVMPVAELDGRQVGRGGVGELTAQIRETYWDWHDDPRFTRSIDYGD